MELTKEKEIERCYLLRKRYPDWLELTFILTDECNFRCDYCYETKTNKRMTIEIADRLIDSLFPIDNKNFYKGFFLQPQEVPYINIIRFNFFGGECLLEIDLINHIIKHFEDKCDEYIKKSKGTLYEKMYSDWKNEYEMLLQTNGWLLRTKKVVEFLDKYENKFVRVGTPTENRKLRTFITIDGCKEFHDRHRKLRDTGEGTWDVVHDNILWYIDRYKHEPETKGTITHETLPYLHKSFQEYIKMGFHWPRATLVEKRNEWTDEDLKIADEQYRLIVNDLLELNKDGIKYGWGTFSSLSKEKFLEDSTLGVGSCGANGCQLVTDASGKLYCCFHFAESSIPSFVRENYSLGDVWNGISDDGLKRIDELLHAYDKYKMEHEECRLCEASTNSCGLCLATNYYETGNINSSPKYSCKITKIEQKWNFVYKYELEALYGIHYN